MGIQRFNREPVPYVCYMQARYKRSPEVQKEWVAVIPLHDDWVECEGFPDLIMALIYKNNIIKLRDRGFFIEMDRRLQKKHRKFLEEQKEKNNG